MSSEYLNNRIFENIIARFQQAKRDRAKYELIVEDMQERERRMIRRVRGKAISWLLKQEEFDRIIHDFHESQKELASAFYTLSENIVRYAKFNLIDADDAIQEGVMICFEKIDRFDPQKGKAFNYMTTCILNHFRQLYRTARNYNELKKKYHDFLQTQFEQALIRNGKERPVYKGAVNS
jgi:DNA-directed RNA polymerase specialized sigma subunit